MTPDRKRRVIQLVFSLVVPLSLLGNAGAQPHTQRLDAEERCRPLSPNETLRVDMKDVPLERLVRLVACGTGERFIFSPTRLKQANVTVVAPRPVSRDELMPLLDSALAQNKLSRDKRGAYHVIEQRAQAPSKRRSSKGR